MSESTNRLLVHANDLRRIADPRGSAVSDSVMLRVIAAALADVCEHLAAPPTGEEDSHE